MSALEIKLSDLHWVDYWSQNGFEKILRSIEYQRSQLGSKHQPTQVKQETIEKIEPEDAKTCFSRGNDLYGLGKYEEAIAAYDQAIAIKPDDPDAWYNKACCYGSQNNLDLALENLQRAIQLDNENKEMAKTDTDFDNIRSDPRF
ncbi:MAG: tetratricopeptide repeat protein [Chloroflexaceae bacterium]|nr:tetratricopeptide repeat protein [Chloroflexaceae bacterium]